MEPATLMAAIVQRVAEHSIWASGRLRRRGRTPLLWSCRQRLEGPAPLLQSALQCAGCRAASGSIVFESGRGMGMGILAVSIVCEVMAIVCVMPALLAACLFSARLWACLVLC